MSDLIQSLENALNEDKYTKSEEALKILRNALRQAYRLSNEKSGTTCS
tara:strand:+ start:90 stop:233 length:144 start_codon:yes stop_codon:yes gene_type:complete